ncbi:MAG: hypothetical protein AAGG08_05305 [Actinomycetota bacterium]
MTSAAPMPQARSRRDSTRVDAMLVDAERRCHELWTTEPVATDDDRTTLLASLSAVESELEAISLTAGHGDEPAHVVRTRLTNALTELARLEQRWRRPAA